MTDLKERMSRGGVVAAWCAVPSPFLAETMACSGFDAITIDLQHGVQEYGHAVSSLQAIDGRGVPVLCRVPWNEPGILMKVLDAGFNGVICPLVNTRHDAEALVRACYYPPMGGRSFGPYRASATHGAGYFDRANDWVVVLPMIETMEAVQNLDEILSVPGISGVYIGPNDLALSMGLPPQLVPPNLMPAAPVREQILGILAKVRAADKLAGIACGSPTMVTHMQQAGFHLTTLCSDVHFFRTGMHHLLAETRAALRTA